MSWQNDTMPLTLASQSPARAQILAHAGLRFEVVVSGVDEAALKNAAGSAADMGALEKLAAALAQAKAEKVSLMPTEGLVIGADQLLYCDGRLLDKPKDAEEARRHLQFLRGKTHILLSACALVRDGACLWSHVARADLTMRDFSDAFLDAYLQKGGAGLLASVGCYRLEAEGAHLFEQIDGDHFAILGLPLPQLLDALRREGGVLA